ncbi:GTP cyclohydrolase II [Companilactobacillus sp. FL22-1]|uniref:GTP cyclohydrolase II n=1 Tax=Companilactobacillus sp. FL22-1 TaxID=3373892 RepID=UPI00375502B9
MDTNSKVETAIATLKNGGLIILADDETREAEGDMVGLASKATTESVNRMITSARGLLCVPVAPEVADRLDLKLMTSENDAFGTAFTVSMDHKSTTTGISAQDRARTIRAIANPQSRQADFYHPGHIFPLISRKEGLLERRGHTEAAIELARLTGESPVAYICEVVKKDGLMARRKNLKSLAEGLRIPMLTIEEVTQYLVKKSLKRLEPTPTVNLPTKYGDFKLTGFKVPGQNQITLALQKGDLDTQKPVLVRLHSECFTGDVFGSLRCDCGAQLHHAMRELENNGSGLILYLPQEGRGIGLFNKLKAYHLQENGVDTYDANVQLGFSADGRNYNQASIILHQLGVNKIKLLTNNPNKVKQLTDYGIEVIQRVPLEIPANKFDYDYLKTKQQKFHHQLNLNEVN